MDDFILMFIYFHFSSPWKEEKKESMHMLSSLHWVPKYLEHTRQCQVKFRSQQFHLCLPCEVTSLDHHLLPPRMHHQQAGMEMSRQILHGFGHHKMCLNLLCHIYVACHNMFYMDFFHCVCTYWSFSVILW